MTALAVCPFLFRVTALAVCPFLFRVTALAVSFFVQGDSLGCVLFCSVWQPWLYVLFLFRATSTLLGFCLFVSFSDMFSLFNITFILETVS